MQSLFPLEPILPEGFAYYPDFLTGKEEEDLCTEIKNTPLHIFHFQGYEAKRKVASFGYDWSFENRTLSKGEPMPQAFDWLLNKVSKHLSIKKEDMAELLLTEYPVGAVINWHRDAPPFDVIVGISLLSNCVFRFRPHDNAKQNRNSIISVPVARRSLYMIQGSARTDWQHSISAVKEVRYSITIRTLKESLQ